MSPTVTNTPVEVAELDLLLWGGGKIFFPVFNYQHYFKITHLSIPIWPKIKDLLLLIAQLRQQLCEAVEQLAQCEGHPGMGRIPEPVFWLLVAMVAASVGLGGLRLLWHATYDSRFIFDR